MTDHLTCPECNSYGNEIIEESQLIGSFYCCTSCGYVFNEDGGKPETCEACQQEIALDNEIVTCDKCMADACDYCTCSKPMVQPDGHAIETTLCRECLAEVMEQASQLTEWICPDCLRVWMVVNDDKVRTCLACNNGTEKTEREPVISHKSMRKWICKKCGTVTYLSFARMRDHNGGWCEKCGYADNPRYDFSREFSRHGRRRGLRESSQEAWPEAPVRPGRMSRADKIATRQGTPNHPKIDVRIRRSVLNRMIAYTKLCDVEINGLATSRYIKTNGDEYYEVDGVLPLFQQVCSGGFTEIATDDLAVWASNQQQKISIAKEANAVWFYRHDMIEQACKTIGLPEDQLRMIMTRWDEKYPTDFKAPKVPENIIERTNVHWHSHVNMSTFWSSTDVGNAKLLAEQFGCRYAILFVLNKKDDVLCKFESFKPQFTDANVKIQVIEDRKWVLDIKQEIKDRVFRSSDGYLVDDKADKIVKRTHAPRSQVGREAIQYALSGIDATETGTETSWHIASTNFVPPEIATISKFEESTGIVHIKNRFERN